ncbi:MAG: 2-hydroxychromene-2-carboxylate isomerase [Parvularculaceae bacterium]|nr:2-hydroxychromene-2-carboxylate isomerase [Parvularculaceae bacterium]
MTKTIEALFDVASPNVYLAWRALPAMLRRTGAELTVTPVLLGGLFKLTGNQTPFTAFAGVKGKLAYDMLEMRRFIERHKLSKFRMNTAFPQNTLLPMRTIVAASRRGAGPRAQEALLAAMWEDDRKIDDPGELSAVYDAAGLPGAELLAAAQEQDVKDELAANTAQAAERGAFGLPTFFVGGEMFFGKERLGQIEEMLAA